MTKLISLDDAFDAVEALMPGDLGEFGVRTRRDLGPNDRYEAWAKMPGAPGVYQYGPSNLAAVVALRSHLASGERVR